MEPFVALGVFSVAGYGAYCLGHKAVIAASEAWHTYREVVRTRSAQQRARAATHRQQGQQRTRLNQLARTLQFALLHLDRAPDFRRAASFAAQASAVPVVFRRRQFRRFRPRIVRHFMVRIRSGADPEALTQSLSELVKNLGVAAYEAEYIRTEAERGLAQATRPIEASYAQRLATTQRDHEQRLDALRELANLDVDTREQLLEAENTRFREALQGLGNADTQHPQP